MLIIMIMILLSPSKKQYHRKIYKLPFNLFFVYLFIYFVLDVLVLLLLTMLCYVMLCYDPVANHS